MSDDSQTHCDSIFSKVINSMKSVFNNSSLLSSDKKPFKRKMTKYVDLKKSTSDVTDEVDSDVTVNIIHVENSGVYENTLNPEECASVSVTEKMESISTKLCVTEKESPADSEFIMDGISDSLIHIKPKLLKRRKEKKLKCKQNFSKALSKDSKSFKDSNASETKSLKREKYVKTLKPEFKEATSNISKSNLMDQLPQSNDNLLTVDELPQTEAKPRIVLKFRSERTGLKSSNIKFICETNKTVLKAVSNAPYTSIDESGKRVASKDIKEPVTQLKLENNAGRRCLRRSQKDLLSFITDNKFKSLRGRDTKHDKKKTRNESFSDEGEITVKRSTRRLSKEYSDNILANAIARKQQSFNEGNNVSMKRRIKPTAKVLANKELRLGLETQNNARLGLPSDKNSEDSGVVQTRRSTRRLMPEMSILPDKSATKPVLKTKLLKKKTWEKERDKNKQLSNNTRTVSQRKGDVSHADDETLTSGKDTPELKPKLSVSDKYYNSKRKTDIQTSEDYEIRRLNKLKRKHLSKLGLRAVASKKSKSDDVASPYEQYTDESTMDSTATEAIIEHMNAQKKSLDDERLNTVTVEDSDDAVDELSSLVSGKFPWGRRLLSHEGIEDATELVSGRPLRTRKRFRSNVTTEAISENESCRSPVVAQTAEDRALGPDEGARTVIGCLCTEHSALYMTPKLLEEPVFCKAIDHIDSMRIGCCHLASKEDEPGSVDYSPLVRPSVKTPYFLACVMHRSRLSLHHCCPGCGLFCTQGMFYQCSRGHFFHADCALPHLVIGETEIPTEDVESNSQLGCPHCGVERATMRNINSDIWRVKIEINCSRRTIVVPYQRMDFSPAYMSFRPPKNRTQSILSQATTNVTSHPNCNDEQPIIPASLLPTIPIDFEVLRAGKLSSIDYDDVLIGAANVESPQEDLFSAIVNKEDKANVADRILSALALHANPHKKLLSVENGTYLHLAAREFNLAAIHILKCMDCDLNACDNQSRTPLMVAILNFDGELFMEADGSTSNTKPELMKASKMAVIKYLVKAGSNVLQKGPDGLTALHLAGKCGNRAACELILDSLPLSSVAPYLNSQDEGGWTPLVWAAENKHIDVVKSLLSRGADLSLSDTERNTALHWAALAGCASTLDCLLSAQACTPQDVNCPNVHGDTPLHVCARQDYYSCVVVLLARGARMDLINTSNETPLDASPDETGESFRAMCLNSQLSILTDGRAWNKPKILSNDISNGREPYPIPCVNEVDDARLPKNFFYVSENCHEELIDIDNKISSMQGCTCRKGNCSEGSCSCVDLSMKCWYDEEGRLLKDFDFADPPMVFECNGTCGCNQLICQNTVVGRRRGTSVFTRVQVFRLNRTTGQSSVFGSAVRENPASDVRESKNSRGWGLRAMTPIPSGSPVTLYCGEVITSETADRRENDEYMFALDLREGYLKEDKTTFCIDAAVRGGAARFINHGCSANLSPVKVFSSHRDLRLPTVVFFATRDITAGEELIFDYGEKFWSVKMKQFQCACGSDSCRYQSQE